MDVKKLLSNSFDVLLAIIVVLYFVFSFFHPDTDDISDNLSYPYFEQCKAVIEWEVEYDEILEQSIIKALHKLPEPILTSWLSIDCKVIVVPDQYDYLEKETAYQTQPIPNQNQFIIAYNNIKSINNNIYYSHIYVLGDVTYLNHAILHEVGHYVYYQYFGINTTYVLPNYEKDYQKYISNDGNYNEYYSSSTEYFSEIFAYTVTHGTTNFYKDTYEMQKIIKNFSE